MATCGNQQQHNRSTARAKSSWFCFSDRTNHYKVGSQPQQNLKIYNKWYHLCLCHSLAKIISSPGSSNCGTEWGMWQSPWRGGRFKHGAYRVPGLSSFVLAQRSANISPILWNNCVWYDLSSPIKKGSVFRKTKTFLLSAVLSHDWAFFLTMLYYYNLCKAWDMEVILITHRKEKRFVYTG